MNASTLDDPRKRRFALLLWGWAMLLVVLLSAAPTGGQPRTRTTGSAFDPATFSVVLRPKQPRLAAAAVTTDNKKQADAVVDGASFGLARSLVATPAPPSHTPALAGRGWSIPDRSPLKRAYGPRAPPRA